MNEIIESLQARGSRRLGKTHSIVDEAARTAARGYEVLLLSATQRRAMDLFRDVVFATQNLCFDGFYKTTASRLQIRFANGGRLMVRSTSYPDQLVGYTPDYFEVDFL